MEVSQQDGSIKVIFTGPIGEEMQFVELPLTPNSEIEIDLGATEYINSCGIRNWMEWVEHLQDQPVKILSCPSFMVEKVNMIHNFFLDHFKVISFSAPYFCDSCENVHVKNFENTRNVEIPEESQCPHCGAMAEIDINPDRYLENIKAKNNA